MFAARDLFQKFGAAALGIAELFAMLLTYLLKLDEKLEVLRKSSYTRDLEAADKLRGNVFRGIISIVAHALKLGNENKRKAAYRLFDLLMQYKKLILNSPYLVESASIANLLQDLRGKYAADVALLGIGSWVTDLEDADREFNDTYGHRIDESIDKPKRDIRALRAQINKLYYLIIGILSAKLTLDGLDGDVVVDPKDLDTGSHEDGDPTPPYLRGNVNYNAVIALNELIRKYNNMIAQHEGHNSSKHEDDDEDVDDNDNDIAEED